MAGTGKFRGNTIALLFFCLLMTASSVWAAEVKSVFDMSLEELASVKVSIATRDARALNDSPGIVTVITRQEFSNRNPRSLLDILELVPGINIVVENLSAPLMQLRGTGNRQNNILLMIDGVRLNSELFGGITYVIKDIPVELVDRVEVIRGPGSAVYGSNAFEAVINVITVPESFEKKNSVLYGGVGSYDTFYGGAALKTKLHGLSLVASAAGKRSDGPSYDYTDMASKSGETRYSQKISNFYARIDGKTFGVTAFYSDEQDGPYIGIKRYLNNGTERQYRTLALEGRYAMDFQDMGKFSGKVYYNSFDYDCTWEIMPPEVVGPNGFIKHPTATDSRLGTELLYENTFFENHRVMAGGNLDEMRLFNSTLERNGRTHPYELRDVPGSWINEDKNYHYALFVQDTFPLFDDFTVTLGGRYDRYSKYGDAFSPRIGVSKSLGKAGHIKLLYGQSFRAPSYYESNTNRHGGLVPNSDIDPERLSSWEAQYSYIRQGFSGKINFYYMTIRDLIKTVKVEGGYSQNNQGDVESFGMEAEVKNALFNDMHSLTVNGYFNYSEDEEHNKVRDVPNYGFNIILDDRWCDHFSSSMWLRYTGRMRRYGIMDNSGNVIQKVDDIPDTVTLNMNLVFHWGDMEFNASVYNIFDEELRSPALGMLNSRGEPLEDYPYEGRFLTAGFEFHF